MKSSDDILLRKVVANLEMMRLAAISTAGLGDIYRELFTAAISEVGDEEEHNRLMDLGDSIIMGVPFGIHDLEWKRKCEERGYGLSQDEFQHWTGEEVANLIGRLELTQQRPELERRLMVDNKMQMLSQHEEDICVGFAEAAVLGAMDFILRGGSKDDSEEFLKMVKDRISTEVLRLDYKKLKAEYEEAELYAPKESKRAPSLVFHRSSVFG